MKSLFEITSPRRVPLNFLLLLLILSTAVVDHASAFGIMGRATTSLSKVFRVMTTDGGAADTTMAEIAEAVDGEIYANAFLEQQSAQDEVDSVVDATDKLLVSAMSSLPSSLSASASDEKTSLV
jgi:glutamine cyclotransferase